MEISKDGGSKANLLVKLQISPILVYLGESRMSCDESCNLDGDSSNQMAHAGMERSSAPLSCEELLLSCEFGHDR